MADVQVAVFIPENKINVDPIYAIVDHNLYCNEMKYGELAWHIVVRGTNK